MSENAIIFVVGVLASTIGALILLLLGIIVWELRQLRREIADRVSDRMCKAMMQDHDDRLEKLEQHVLLGKGK